MVVFAPWLVAYFLPALIAFVVALRVREKQLAIMHGGLLVSIALSFAWGARLQVSFDLVAAVFFLVALVVSFMFLNKYGLVYALSSVIQEICLLLAAVLLIPLVGIPSAAFGTGIIYALVHLLDRKGWQWKVLLMLAWGMASIFLYGWLEQPLWNIALHTLVGVLLIKRGLILPGRAASNVIL